MDILSIDFDYFQKFPEDALLREKILMWYPDPIDYDTKISEVVWGNRYSIAPIEDLLKKVTINFDSLEELKHRLLLLQTRTPVLVVNSHHHIFEFIKKVAKPGVKLRVANLDYHHDAYFRSENVGCGNWVWHLQNNHKLDYVWVRPEHANEYGTSHVLDAEPRCYDSLEDFYREEEKFRPKAIFVCRSDPYFPPHLDKYFEDFIGYLSCLFTNVIGEQGITQCRKIVHSDFGGLKG